MSRDRPRVALVGPAAGARGGIAAFGAHLARALSARATVMTLDFERLYPGWTRPGRLHADSGATPAGDESRRGLVPWDPRTWRASGARIERFAPDLVVVQWWHPALAPCLRSVSRRARTGGATVAFVCHNPSPHERFPAGRWLTRSALSSADLVLVLSRSAEETLRQHLPRVTVRRMPHPPYDWPESSPEAMAAWRARVGNGRPIVLFFGYVRPYKGLEDLIRAMPAVRARYSEATLVVAGPFLDRAERYRGLSERLGVEDAVRLFPGYVPDDEVRALFEAAAVVALPYRSATQSGVIPQALSLGKRVVATAVGGIAEAVNGNGVVVPPSDPAALSEGVIRALETSTRDGLAPPAPQLASGGSWSDWADVLLRGPAVGVSS